VSESTKFEAVSLVKTYRKRMVVDNISIYINKAEIVGLLGPNGAGKTTTFNMMVGMVKPKSGQVLLNKKNITNKPMHLRAKLGIGYLPQEPSIFRKMSVQDNIMAILETTGKNRQQRKHRLEELLTEFKIEHLRKSSALDLSGGERRRLEIARAMTIDPDFLLLDEPFAGIDPIAVEEIQNMIDQLKNKGMGVLITDHNVRETLSITDRSYIMYEGKLLVEGTAEHLVKDERAREKYLGKSFSLR